METEEIYVIFFKSVSNQIKAGSQFTVLVFCNDLIICCNYKLLHVLKCYVILKLNLCFLGGITVFVFLFTQKDVETNIVC